MDIALGLFLTFLLVVASVVISLAEISFAAARETRLRVLHPPDVCVEMP